MAAAAEPPRKKGLNREPIPGHKEDDGPKRDRNLSGDTGIYPPGTAVPDEPEYRNPTVEEALKSSLETFGCQSRVGMLRPSEYQTEEGKLESPVSSFHVHHYFDGKDPAQVREALELRQSVLDTFPDITVNRPHRDPIGPHPIGMWELELHTPRQFSTYLAWLTAHHGNLNALIHPNTGKGFLDHTVNAYWIGKKEGVTKLQAGVEQRMGDLMARMKKAAEAKKASKL